MGNLTHARELLAALTLQHDDGVFMTQHQGATLSLNESGAIMVRICRSGRWAAYYLDPGDDEKPVAELARELLALDAEQRARFAHASDR